MKRWAWFIIMVAVLVSVLMLTACGSTTKPNDGVWTIPHDLGLGSTNCLVCHAGGLHVVPAEHTEDEYPLKTCALPACHSRSGEVAPPVVGVTTDHITLANGACTACHGVNKDNEFSIITEHSILTDNVCLTCHEVAG